MGKNLVKATSVVLMVNLVVKLLGFIRETVIAGSFGTSQAVDAYLIAYTVPYFLQWVLGAALVSVVVPVITRYLVKGEKDTANYVASAVFNLTVVAMIGLTVISLIFSVPLIKILSPGFDGEATRIAVELTKIMLPSTIFMAGAMVFTGVLNASYKFAVPAIAPGVSSLIVIIGTLLTADKFGVEGLAWATFISYLGFLLVHLPVLKQIGFKYKFTFGLKHPAVKEVLKNILPIAIGGAVNQIYFALNRIFASGLAEGSIAALNYGNKLMMLPLGVFVAAVASTIYPALSELAIMEKKREMAKTLQKGLGLIALISVPAVVGLIVLRVPIVELLFERGAFDHESTLMTANALLFAAIGLVPMGFNMVLTKAFYSLNDAKTPVKIGLYSVGINIILSLVLFKLIPFGGGGLALANSLAVFACTIWLYSVLRKRMLPEIDNVAFLKSLIKMSIAALVMGVAVFFTMKLLAPIGILVNVIGSILVGVVVYFVLVVVLKIEELQGLMDIVKRKLGK